MTDLVITPSEGSVPTDARARLAGELAVLLSRLGSPHSRRAYAGDWGRFVAFLNARGMDPFTAGPVDVGAFLASMSNPKGEPAAISTRARALSVLREVFAAVYRAGLRRDNPAREIEVPRVQRDPRTPWLTEMQLVLLLHRDGETWVERRNHLVLLFVLGLAVRRSSATTARVEHLIRRPDGRLGIRVYGKGNKTADLLMPFWLAREVEDWIQFSGVTGPLFPRLRRVGYDDVRPEMNKSIGSSAVWEIVKAAAARAGIDPRLATPHALRRSYVTIARERGAALADLQAALMHEKSETTERYDRAVRAMKVAPGDVFADIIDAANRGAGRG